MQYKKGGSSIDITLFPKNPFGNSETCAYKAGAYIESSSRDELVLPIAVAWSQLTKSIISID